MRIHLNFMRPLATLFPALLLALPVWGSDLNMKVTDSGYLDALGVSIMLFNDNYSPVFYDRKDAAMQIVLHGHRIATDGSVRLSPTPEQWDAIPKIGEHQADKENNRLSASYSYADYNLSDQVVVAAEPGCMIPGYVVINPDFPECISDFGMLWFEDETTVSAASSWVLVANAAEAIVNEKRGARPASGN